MKFRLCGMSLLALCIGVGTMLGLGRVSVKCTNIHHLNVSANFVEFMFTLLLFCCKCKCFLLHLQNPM